MIPNVPFEIMFDMATEYTEDLTPQQGSLLGRGGEGLGERSTEE
jgi:hypothetical protein